MDQTLGQVLLISSAAAFGTAVILLLHRKSALKMMEIIVGRTPPALLKRHRRRVSPGPLPDVAKYLNCSAKRLEGHTHRNVRIQSRDGLTLIGHWYCPEHPKRVIVAMHGWRSSWSSDFGMIAPFWRANDCAVLFAEQRAQGTSDGEYISFGLLERYDCLAWARWADAQFASRLPIYLVGISMGASTILMAASLPLPAAVSGIIADCGFTSPHAIWRHVMERHLHLPYRLYQSAAQRYCEDRLKVDRSFSCCADALTNCQVPILFIHGTDDRLVPIRMTYENYQACASPKRLFVVPGAEHGMCYVVDREGYEEEVRNFWKAYDGTFLRV